MKKRTKVAIVLSGVWSIVVTLFGIREALGYLANYAEFLTIILTGAALPLSILWGCIWIFTDRASAAAVPKNTILPEPTNLRPSAIVPGIREERGKSPVTGEVALALADRTTDSDCLKNIRVISEDSGRISVEGISYVLDVKGRPLARTKSGASVYAFRPYLSKKGMIELYWPDGRTRTIVFEFTVADSVWNLAHELKQNEDKNEPKKSL